MVYGEKIPFCCLSSNADKIVSINLFTVVFLYVIRKEKNLRRMNTAVKLNQLVKDRSKGTQLLVINLPGPPSDENDWQHCILFKPLGVRVSETS